jgi:hypothetical protein
LIDAQPIQAFPNDNLSLFFLPLHAGKKEIKKKQKNKETTELVS